MILRILVCVCVCGALWLRPLAHNPRVVSSSLSGPKVFVIISIHENGMVVHLCTPVHPAVMGTWNFPGCKFPGHVSLKLAKGPGGTSGAHTQQLRGMVRLLRVPSPAPGACEHWLTVPA